LAYARVFYPISILDYYFMVSEDFPDAERSVVIDALPVVMDLRFLFSGRDSIGFYSSFGAKDETNGAGGFTIVWGT
jgi:hypothetical protein